MRRSSRHDISPEAKRAGRRWGLAITLGLATVVVVNLYVAWLVGDDGFPLVTEDYYEEGLAYDETIDRGQRNQARELTVRVNDNGRVVVYRDAAPVAVSEPIVMYYRPDDPKLDYVTTARVNGTEVVPVTRPSVGGRWNVSLIANVDGERTHLSTRAYLSAP